MNYVKSPKRNLGRKRRIALLTIWTWKGFPSVTPKWKLGKFRTRSYDLLLLLLFSKNSCPNMLSFERWPEGMVKSWLIWTRHGIKDETGSIWRPQYAIPTSDPIYLAVPVGSQEVSSWRNAEGKWAWATILHTYFTYFRIAFDSFSESLLPWESLPQEKTRTGMKKLCILPSVSGWKMRIRRFV